MRGTPGILTTMEPRFCGLRMTSSFPSSTCYFQSPRDARLVHSTVSSSRIENILATSSRGNHTPSLSETLLFTCSRVRVPSTTSCAPQSDSPADSLVTKVNELPERRKSIDRRVITSENDRRERLIQLVASQLKQAALWGIVGEKAAILSGHTPAVRKGDDARPNPTVSSISVVRG